VPRLNAHVPYVNPHLAAQLRDAVLRPGPDPTYADGDDAAWMSIDWSAHTREVGVLGARMNVVDTGPPPGDGRTDEALLFVHGLGGNWQNWLLNLPVFMREHRCIAPDLPGFGHSELPGEPVSISGYARALDALCAELGIERVTVVGHSMGGFLGAELTIAFPTRVDRLVLVSAAGLSIENARKQPLLTLARVSSATSRYWTQRVGLAVKRPRVREVALAGVVRYPRKLSAPLTWELVQGSGKRGFYPALEALMSYSFRQRLREIEIPVLIVWGRTDLLVPVTDAQAFAELIGANARVVIFEDTMHTPMIERPSRFNALVGEFIAGRAAPEADVAGTSGAQASEAAA
jgi:pimeloyl-ACP methyl ester carboxylesterase